jgi:hypothetical protein
MGTDKSKQNLKEEITYLLTLLYFTLLYLLTNLLKH